MPHQSDPAAPRRLSVFWWTLINILAIAFAVLSWTGCYFLFNFPERSWNYSVLQKFGRLPEISFFEKEDLPKAIALTPRRLYGLIYERNQSAGLPKLMEAETLATLNVQLKRNYITNFQEAKNVNYVGGTWRILSVRKLTQEDFVSDGFAVLAQALVIPEEQENSTRPQMLPFPVELEIILPTAPGQSIPDDAEVVADNSFNLTKGNHALVILHLSRSGARDEPITRVTAIPLIEADFPLGKSSQIPLTIPTTINPRGRFPLISSAKDE